MSKILLCCIFKDDTELPEITRMLESFMPHMAGLAVAITGQGETKRLKALIKKYGGRYVHTTPQTHPDIYAKTETGYLFANFAAARNASFALAETMEGYDWWTWADADDVLINGQELDKVATRATEMKIDTVFFTYWYSCVLTPEGDIRDIAIDHLRERLLKPGIFKWVSRLHEVAVPKDGNYQPQHTAYIYDEKAGQTCVWAHLTNEERVTSALERNAKLLDIQIREEERKDPRTIFYLAKTYYDMKKPELDPLAEQLIIDDYLRMSGWAEERASAWEYVGNIRARRGDHQGAILAYHESIKEFGNRNMPYLLLAKEYQEVGRAEDAAFWLETALRMDPPSTRTTIGNPVEIKFLASTLKLNQALKTNNIDDALHWVKVRNQIAGVTDDVMVEELERLKLMNEAAKWVFNYAKWLKDMGHADKIPALLSSLPLELGREPFAHFIAQDYQTPRIWGEKEICYVASFGTEHFEQWSGKSLKRGIGGSETAVIRLAEEWVKQGYKVTVYGDPREDEGEIEGVTYRPWYEINWRDQFNILIFWRSPHLLDRDVTARKIFMDLHDVASQLDWNEKRMDKVDRVFFKSKYHRSMLPKLPDTKSAIISNGI